MKSDPTSSNTSCNLTLEWAGGRGAPLRHLVEFRGSLGERRARGGREGGRDGGRADISRVSFELNYPFLIKCTCEVMLTMWGDRS